MGGVYPVIISLIYLSSNDESIVNDEDTGTPLSVCIVEEDDGSPMTNGIPSNRYAVIASAANVMIAVMAVSVRCCRINNDVQEGEEEDEELTTLSPTKDVSIVTLTT